MGDTIPIVDRVAACARHRAASHCHLSLDDDAPESRPVQGPELGQVVELPEVGRLHHRYVREAA
jgi:hypothetical protein